MKFTNHLATHEVRVDRMAADLRDRGFQTLLDSGWVIAGHTVMEDKGQQKLVFFLQRTPETQLLEESSVANEGAYRLLMALVILEVLSLPLTILAVVSIFLG